MTPYKKGSRRLQSSEDDAELLLTRLGDSHEKSILKRIKEKTLASVLQLLKNELFN